MSLFIDYLAGLGLDAGKDYLIDKKKDGEISRSILSYTDEQKDLPINHAAVTLPLSAANVFLHTE